MEGEASMAEMKVQYVPIGQVNPYENNPRKNKAAVDYVANSIKEFGWRQPIVTDKDFVIIVGHTRLQAAKKLKLKEVPVLVADDMTEEQAKAYRLADNKTAEFAEWDFDLLNDELLNLDMDMTLFGFEDAEEKEETDDVEHSTLTDKFIVPPFSILDTRQGYWQDRKKAWKDLGLKSDLGRNDNLIGGPDLPQCVS